MASALLAKQNPVLVAALAEKRVEGKAEGKAEGKVEGKVEGKAEALLAVLAARGLSPSVAERERILAAQDNAMLERWLGRAVSCSSVEELFE
jgi:predicted transposase YdaD